MIVDVIDMGIENLSFNFGYHQSRYKKAERLYDSRAVTIKQVEKLGENNFKVDAKVNENRYLNFNVMLKIRDGKVFENKCDCPESAGGFVCRHMLATAKEILGPHEATTEDGKKRLNKIKEEEERRRLEELKRIREEANARRLYDKKYTRGINTLEYFKSSVYRNNQAGIDINDLYETTVNERKNKNVSELATEVRLQWYVEFDNQEKIRVSFKIGQKRMYALTNVLDLYKAYKSGEEISYGKQLRFIPKEENFAEDSKEMFRFMMQYAEMVEYNNRFNAFRSSLPCSKWITVGAEKLDEFFDMNRESGLTVKSHYEGEEQYEFTNEKLDVGCILKKDEVKTSLSPYWYYEDDDDDWVVSNEYVLELNVKDYGRVMSNNKIYFFNDKKIYTVEKDSETTRLLDMLRGSERILIPEDRLEEFKNVVLSQIKNLKVEDIPDAKAIEAVVVNKLATKVFLDIDDKGNITLELKFCYNDYEFNILQTGYKTYVRENNIVRDIPAETEVLKRLFTDGFELVTGKKEFVMKNLDFMYDFLLNKIEGYMHDYEVLATDKFKNKQIRQPKISNIGVRVDNGLLEISLSKMNIDIGEIRDVLKDYSVKKKYHKLKNGDFLDLRNNEDLNLLAEMSETLDIDYSKIENGNINLPVSRSFYLENLIGSNKSIGISKNEEFKNIIDSVQENEEIEIDEEFESKLRDYQKTGYRWLKNLEKYKFGGILADDMGLGKTIQVIALLQAESKKKEKTTSIVVCPSTLVLNWKAEIEKWCNYIKVLTVKGMQLDRKEMLENYKDYDVIITSYDLLKRDIELYEDKEFKYIIADEAQYIKNSTTQNAMSLKSLKGEIKFALTGTPIENSVAELWSIFDFIMPGYLYNYNKFKKKFEEPILKFEDEEALRRLKKLISPFILRRVKKDVLTELPEKNITIMKNEMESEQEKIYMSYLAQTRKEVAAELNDNSFEKSKFKILMLLTRLRQICCHPSLFLDNYNGESGKLKQCLNLVTDAIQSGHKILLFSSYTSMLEIIEKELEKSNIKYFKLVGNTPVSKRIEMVDEFNNSEDVKIFLISLKAGGTGLNLTSADVVIHYDPWWNVSSENQATDRAYRMGQQNSVQVYKLITSDSIEEKINKMQERKEKISKDLLSTEETFISKLSKEEILDLFK